MEPQSARAFLTGQIMKAGRPDIVTAIRDYEKSKLPPGRYLTGFEICQWLIRTLRKSFKPPLEIVNPNEEETEKMDALWKRYRATELAVSESFETEHPDLVPLSKAEQIHRWEDWACEEMGLLSTVK